MTTVILEGNLCFTFPDSCAAVKYDHWSYYRNQFQRAFGASRAMDMLCLTRRPPTLWMVEVKDYRRHRRTKVVDLGDEIAFKVRDTLAGLLSARLHAGNEAEKTFADKAVKVQRLRVVLHLEQPAKHSKLFPRAIDPADMVLKLSQRLKAIDPHPRVMDRRASPPERIWTVEENRQQSSTHAG